ncbi:MAG: HpcH/HpaI aldolase/citrate lyase family protein [Ignavibacteriae bacterium]|nr:HpcH/HpaI aldolase/citrate lyase family protein [Ignavibacteriota bacterium]
MISSANAGRRGKDVRSDCWVEITLRDSGGLHLSLKSKVDVLYGRSIRALVHDVLQFYGITDAEVQVDDSGALPYTLAARVEAAVRRLRPDEQRSYLLPFEEGITAPSARDRFRRSRLYLPGNDPKLAVNAAIHQPDGIILDLEDSVAPDQKDAARLLVRNTLRAVDFGGAERMVRINQLPAGYADLEAVIPQLPDLILIPKCESVEDVCDVDAAIDRIQREHGLTATVYLMPIIESARGALHALDIAGASPSVVALAIGLEDYTADIGAERTLEGNESLWMRGMVVNAARAAGVQPIDTVFSDVGDMDGLRASAREARSLGFDGKGCIHPRQIAVVHEAFLPETKELEKAKKIVSAFEDAERRGLGVVALGSKMIDPPVVKRALRTIDIAVKAGVLSAAWREEGGNV